uniref:Integrator complex subunit 7 N-terminal domain-containing protein n=1 Tax=Branchiostoma floridae TaxID=7739 RepID=C3Y088_BRAFL|eukprot:XP_002610151.1 hypothetical protein BRAFLDRAFT_77104 [Branchiostoma floridae]
MASGSVGSKFSGLGAEKYGADQEQDANSALLELDKGLRSTRVGEQCEAIVRFPRLFEKYPFPILINSSFLKLADVFRIGNNFLRLCVLRVTQQSEKHLDKILNVDEFLRRIFSVIHSNDPIARALTLRVLGSIACIISERKNTHHSIRTSLDSHDEVEMEAAIFAASCFAAQSRTFAVGICNKIAEMIQGLATPVEMKLKLIPIFQHMHHDAQTAAKVRQLCVEMLPSYPARGFVMVTLHTLSLLSAKTLIDIPQQASVTPTFPLEFQTQFTQLRAELLQAHANLLAACTTLQTCPPPAIATAMANVSGKEIQRTGRIGTQLQQCVAQFRMLSAKYGDLLQASFDADLTTLKSLTQYPLSF